VLVALAVLLLVDPAAIPGLTIPHNMGGGEMGRMGAMGS